MVVWFNVIWGFAELEKWIVKEVHHFLRLHKMLTKSRQEHTLYTPIYANNTL